MSYRTWLLLTAGAGALPAGIFCVMFVAIDRPRHRDRYANLVAGLGLLAFLGFAIPFVLTLLAGAIPRPGAVQWAVSVGLRGLSVAWMYWLLWIYLTPGRARLRLTRREPEGPPDAPDS